MKPKPVTLFFLRHGKTTYTGQFPDLTDEGVAEIAKAAEYIQSIVGKSDNFRIVSSPLPRALGTADIIAKRMAYPLDVEPELALRCMDFHDPVAAQAVWASYPSARHVDCAYCTDPQFEDGKVLEKRSAIQNRFFGYLGTLFDRFMSGNLPDFQIHTSHYEVLWALAATFGFEEPLIHGEVIKLELSASEEPNKVHVRATFREYSREFDCELPAKTFASQFE